jgi:cytochrome c oxidase subunit 3
VTFGGWPDEAGDPTQDVPSRGARVSAAAGVQGEAQTNTGWSNQKFGLILFIASEAILFGALFANYFYNRAYSRGWPPEGDVHPRVPAVPLALILTIILLTSGLTCRNAVAAIKQGRQIGMLGWLTATIALGLLFLSGQAYEYVGLFQEGITPNSGLYGTSFYALTGMHGAHVIAGVGLLVAMYIRGLAGHFSPRHHFGLEGAMYYWEFVDAVWVALYLAVYIF